MSHKLLNCISTCAGAHIYTDVDSLLPVHVHVITAKCKPFTQQETKEICQAREAVALVNFIRKAHNNFCCKQGDGYIQQDHACGNQVKQEDCDSECRKKCLIYTQEKNDLEGYWELLEPLKEVQHHSGSSKNLGVSGTSYAFSGRVGSTIFVSFKGSGSAVGDWTANINFAEITFTTAEWNWKHPPGSVLAKLGILSSQPHLDVHKGFFEYYNGVRESILDHVEWLISERPASEIHVSGHSLGGAMANLCAVDFAAKYPDVKVALWTFGAPRVFRGATDKDYFGSGKNSAMNGVCVCAWMSE